MQSQDDKGHQKVAHFDHWLQDERCSCADPEAELESGGFIRGKGTVNDDQTDDVNGYDEIACLVECTVEAIPNVEREVSVVGQQVRMDDCVGVNSGKCDCS